MDVLSADQAIYEQYARAVRKEYRLIPRPIYRKGRLKVLQAFLDSERIYHSAPWRDREEAARRNIRWEMDTWTSRGKLA
jgi:predicted metal-dependent HD superfamily phosphohydrolase